MNKARRRGKRQRYIFSIPAMSALLGVAAVVGFTSGYLLAFLQS